MPYKDRAKKREYQRKWLIARRQVWIDENGPCVQCGSCDRLEVDHIDQAAKVTHRVWSWSQKRRDIELAKCQVLCYDCHKKKTISETPPAQHGKDHLYNLGYRCKLCYEFKSRRNAERIR